MRKLLIGMVFSVVLLAGSVVCLADEKAEDVWETDILTGENMRQFEPTPEMIDGFLRWLSNEDAEKAEELSKLREQDPAKFREELGKLMREIYEQRMRMRRGPGDEGRGPGGEGRGPDGPGGRGDRGGQRADSNSLDRRGPDRGPGEREFGFFERMGEEFVKWIGEVYPEDANELGALKNDESKYQEKLRTLARRHRRKFEMSRGNAELGKILRSQEELNISESRCLEIIRGDSGSEEKNAAVETLKEVLSRKYDLIVARKKMVYEQLSKRLEELQKQVNESQSMIDKYQEADFKEGQLKARLEELIGKERGFDWN